MRPTEALRQKLLSIGALSDEPIEALDRLPLQLVNLERDQQAVGDGDVSNSCCLLVDGVMRRQKVLRHGGRQILAFNFPGGIPDLQSLRLKRMDHSLVATTDCRVAFIRHDVMIELLHANLILNDLFWRDTLIDAATFRTWIATMGRQHAVHHMAHLFCEIFVRIAAVGLSQGNRCSLPLRQDEVADALGINLVHTNRSLQDLREAGLLAFDGRTLTILDWPGLSSTAEFDPTYLHLVRRDDFDPADPTGS